MFDVERCLELPGHSGRMQIWGRTIRKIVAMWRRAGTGIAYQPNIRSRDSNRAALLDAARN
jgi:hypothetical protein